MKNRFNNNSIFILDGQGYGVFMYGIFGNYKNKVSEKKKMYNRASFTGE